MDKPRKPEPQTEKRSPPKDENQGEGNKTADRNYREHLREFEEQHDVGALGRAARREVENDQEGYRAAEEEGRRHLAEEDPELYRKGEESVEEEMKKDLSRK